jgi:hypothetical protein
MEKGGGGPKSNDSTETLVLYILYSPYGEDASLPVLQVADREAVNGIVSSKGDSKSGYILPLASNSIFSS